MSNMSCLTRHAFRAADFGTVYGALSSVMGFAGIAAPLIAGRAYDLTGSYRGMLLAGMGIAAIAALLLYSIARQPALVQPVLVRHPGT